MTQLPTHPVKTVELNDGSKLPLMGLGTWRLFGSECRDVASMALDIGYRHFDTAGFYDNHKPLGEALKKHRREELFITSKVWYDSMGDKAPKALKHSLKELDMEYLDLFLIHWPHPRELLVKTYESLLPCIEEGLIRSLGVSNCTINHLKLLLDKGYTPSVNQVELHPYLPQKELVAFCQDNNIAVEAYCPLFRFEATHATLRFIASQKHATEAQIMLAWLMQQNIVAIPKSSSSAHLQENFNATKITLSDEEMHAIASVDNNTRLVTFAECADFDF